MKRRKDSAIPSNSKWLTSNQLWPRGNRCKESLKKDVVVTKLLRSSKNKSLWS